MKKGKRELDNPYVKADALPINSLCQEGSHLYQDSVSSARGFKILLHNPTA